MHRSAASPARPRVWRRAVRVLAAVPVCACLAACSDRAARGPSPADDGPPVYGGTLVIAAPTDLDFANGLVSAEARTQALIRSILFLTLLRYDADLDYAPGLAESWEMLGDTGVVFHLRDDVFWHDGVRTTAHDVAFTYARAKDPATAFPNASSFAEWREVEVVDSFTVRFRIVPHADPLAAWPAFPIMPRHRLDSIPPDRLRQAGFNRDPVGNGPFRFVSQRPNDRWTFEANEAFPEALGGRPYLDRVVWRVIPEHAAQIAELRTGTVDLTLSTPSEQLAELDARPELRAIVRPSRKYQFIGWNGRRPPLDDPRVRRALTLAIDRREILEVLRDGYGEPAVGPIDPSHWAFHDGLEPLPFDTAGARALLAEAGFQDRDGDGTLEDAAGRDLELALTVPTTDYNRDLGEMVRADLAAIGVALRVRAVDFNTMVGDITSPERRFDGVVLAWEAGLRPSELRDIFHSDAIDGPFQFASYRNAEIDRILDEASRLASRDAARPPWHRLQEILLQEQPWTFLFYTPDLYVLNERVRGVEMDVRGAFEGLPRWWKVPDPAVAAADGAP